MIIYKTTNLINGKIYVGKDTYNNPSYLGSGIYISRAIKKYGKQNFIKEVIDSTESLEELNEKEKYWVKFCNCKVPNGYNLTDGGEGAPGYRWTKKQKNKISGNNNSMKNLETRKKNIDSHKGYKPWNKGLTKYVDERVERNAKALRRVPKSLHHRQNLSKLRKGKTWEDIFGKERAEEMRKKRVEWAKGRHYKWKKKIKLEIFKEL